MNPVVRRVLFGNALAAIGSGLTLPLLIVYLGQVRGLGTAVGGFVVAYIALLQLILLPLTGILVDRLGPRPALMGGLLVQGAGVALLTQVDSIATAYAVALYAELRGIRSRLRALETVPTGRDGHYRTSHGRTAPE